MSDNESIAEDEGSLLDHLDESVTQCSTLLADLSPSSTQSLATQSIDALVARTGPPPPPLLPFRSLAATRLVDVDYCRIQIERVNLFDTVPGDAGDEWLASQCRSELKTLGQDAQLCLRYELPPLTSNPEIAGGGARAFVDDNARQATVTVGSVSKIYPLPPSSAARDGRVTTNRRRIGSKSKGRPTANAREKPRSVVGGSSCGGVFQLKHSNLLAIAFVSDKDVVSWGGSIAIELVCNAVGVVDRRASADSPRLASCTFPLEDVLRSRSFDVRAKLDLLPLGSPSSSSPEAIGSLVARVTLIGGHSCADIDNGVSESAYTTLPIVESPQETSVAASGQRLVEETRNERAVDDSSVPPKSSSGLQDHEVRGQPPLQIPNVPPTMSDLSLLSPPSAPLSAPSPQHRRHLECQPVVHPSDTRVVLERQEGRQNEHAARRIQSCVRDHLLRRRRQRQAEKEEEFDPDVPMESPPPPPTSSPTPPSAPLTSNVPVQGGSTPVGSPLSEPCRPCDISSLGDCSPPISSPKNVVESDLDTPPPRAEFRFCIRLGSCKGLVEVVSTWQEPGLHPLESSAAVAVSCTIFEGLERLEATFYSKALPLRLSTSSFDFDAKQMVAISLSDKRVVEYLQNETLKVELWLLPAPHSSTLESTGASTFAKIIDKNLVATASLPLVPLLDCSGGCRQNISWRPTGWLGEERVGSIEVAIFREGVSMDKLQSYFGDTFSLSGASSVRDSGEEDGNAASSVRDSGEEDGNAAMELCRPGDAMDNDGTRQAALPSVSSPSLHSSTGSALKTPPNSDSGSGSDSDGSDGTTNSISSRRSSSDTATGSSSDTSTSAVSSSGSSSRSSEGNGSIGEARSLSGVMDSLESVKRTLSRHFDGNVESDKDDADGDANVAPGNRSAKEEEDGDGTGSTSSMTPTATKKSHRRAASNDGQDATLRGTSFADVGTSPIDPGTLDEKSGPMDDEGGSSTLSSIKSDDNPVSDVASSTRVSDVASSTTREEAASQTDADGKADGGTPRAGRRTNRSTNTEPIQSPASSSTGSSDSDTVLPSGFRRRRRLLPPSDAAGNIESPATHRALTRARIPLEYRRSRSNETATLSRHLCNTDRISSIMAQYSRPSGILRPPTYSSSSSSSDGEDDSGEE